jgi:hypothetical protein
MATLVRPYVVSVPEVWWWGRPGPLLPQPEPSKTLEQTRGEVLDLSLDYMAEKDIKPIEQFPDHVIGLQRLIPEGDVERVKDLLDDLKRHDDAFHERPPDKTEGG